MRFSFVIIIILTVVIFSIGCIEPEEKECESTMDTLKCNSLQGARAGISCSTDADCVNCAGNKCPGIPSAGDCENGCCVCFLRPPCEIDLDCMEWDCPEGFQPFCRTSGASGGQKECICSTS